MQQKHSDCWKCVQAGLRILTLTKSRYAVIDQEMLGVAWAMGIAKMQVLCQGTTKHRGNNRSYGSPLLPITISSTDWS